MASQLEIANIALGHLGTLKMASYDEASAEGEHVRRQWDLARDAILRQRHWNFAIKRATLTLTGAVALSSVSVTLGSTSVTVGSASGLSVGMAIKADFVPAGTTITAISGTTLTLSAAAGTTLTGQTATAYNGPPFGYAYSFDLPSDYLRALEVNGIDAGTGKATWDIEGNKLLTDEATVQLRYTAKVTDTTLWDQSFVEAFAFKLAARVAPGISTAVGLAGQMDQRADEYLLRAFGPDNIESKPRAVQAWDGSGYLEARRGRNLW